MYIYPAALHYTYVHYSIHLVINHIILFTQPHYIYLSSIMLSDTAILYLFMQLDRTYLHKTFLF